MILHKDIASLIHCIKEENSPPLDKIYIEEKEDKIVAVACDTRILRILKQEKISEENYPKISGTPNGNIKKAYLSINTTKSLKKNIEKEKTPYLKDVLAVVTPNGKDRLQFTNTIVKEEVISLSEQQDIGEYPKWQEIIPKKEPVFKIILGMEVLERLLKTVKEYKKNFRREIGGREIGLIFEFRGPEEAFTVDVLPNETTKLSFVAMPMRDVRQK